MATKPVTPQKIQEQTSISRSQPAQKSAVIAQDRGVQNRSANVITQSRATPPRPDPSKN